MAFVSSNQVKLPRAVWVALILIPLAAAVAEVTHAVKARADSLLSRPQADSLYVRRDTFEVYRIMNGATLDQIARDVEELHRACQHEGRCP